MTFYENGEDVNYTYRCVLKLLIILIEFLCISEPSYSTMHGRNSTANTVKRK